MHEKTRRLLDALETALREAPPNRRSELAEALDEYNATFVQWRDRRPPLLRYLMERVALGAEHPEDERMRPADHAEGSFIRAVYGIHRRRGLHPDEAWAETLIDLGHWARGRGLTHQRIHEIIEAAEAEGIRPATSG